MMEIGLGMTKGVHYLIVRDPENYNHYGDNMAKGKLVMETVEIPPRLELPGALCIFESD